MPRTLKEDTQWTTIRVSKEVHERIQAIGRSLDSKMINDTIEDVVSCYERNTVVASDGEEGSSGPFEVSGLSFENK